MIREKIANGLKGLNSFRCRQTLHTVADGLIKSLGEKLAFGSHRGNDLLNSNLTVIDCLLNGI